MDEALRRRGAERQDDALVLQPAGAVEIQVAALVFLALRAGCDDRGAQAQVDRALAGGGAAVRVGPRGAGAVGPGLVRASSESIVGPAGRDAVRIRPRGRSPEVVAVRQQAGLAQRVGEPFGQLAARAVVDPRGAGGQGGAVPVGPVHLEAAGVAAGVVAEGRCQAQLGPRRLDDLLRQPAALGVGLVGDRARLGRLARGTPGGGRAGRQPVAVRRGIVEIGGAGGGLPAGVEIRRTRVLVGDGASGGREVAVAIAVREGGAGLGHQRAVQRAAEFVLGLGARLDEREVPLLKRRAAEGLHGRGRHEVVDPGREVALQERALGQHPGMRKALLQGVHAVQAGTRVERTHGAEPLEAATLQVHAGAEVVVLQPVRGAGADVRVELADHVHRQLHVDLGKRCIAPAGVVRLRDDRVPHRLAHAQAVGRDRQRVGRGRRRVVQVVLHGTAVGVVAVAEIAEPVAVRVEDEPRRAVRRLESEGERGGIAVAARAQDVPLLLRRVDVQQVGATVAVHVGHELCTGDAGRGTGRHATERAVAGRQEHGRGGDDVGAAVGIEVCEARHVDELAGRPDRGRGAEAVRHQHQRRVAAREVEAGGDDVAAAVAVEIGERGRRGRVVAREAADGGCRQLGSGLERHVAGRDGGVAPDPQFGADDGDEVGQAVAVPVHRAELAVDRHARVRRGERRTAHRREQPGAALRHQPLLARAAGEAADQQAARIGRHQAGVDGGGKSGGCAEGSPPARVAATVRLGQQQVLQAVAVEVDGQGQRGGRGVEVRLLHRRVRIAAAEVGETGGREAARGGALGDRGESQAAGGGARVVREVVRADHRRSAVAADRDAVELVGLADRGAIDEADVRVGGRPGRVGEVDLVERPLARGRDRIGDAGDAVGTDVAPVAVRVERGIVLVGDEDLVRRGRLAVTDARECPGLPRAALRLDLRIRRRAVFVHEAVARRQHERGHQPGRHLGDAGKGLDLGGVDRARRTVASADELQLLPVEAQSAGAAVERRSGSAVLGQRAIAGVDDRQAGQRPALAEHAVGAARVVLEGQAQVDLADTGRRPQRQAVAGRTGARDLQRAGRVAGLDGGRQRDRAGHDRLGARQDRCRIGRQDDGIGDEGLRVDGLREAEPGDEREQGRGASRQCGPSPVGNTNRVAHGSPPCEWSPWQHPCRRAVAVPPGNLARLLRYEFPARGGPGHARPRAVNSSPI